MKLAQEKTQPNSHSFRQRAISVLVCVSVSCDRNVYAFADCDGTFENHTFIKIIAVLSDALECVCACL